MPRSENSEPFSWGTRTRVVFVVSSMRGVPRVSPLLVPTACLCVFCCMITQERKSATVCLLVVVLVSLDVEFMCP